MVGSLVRFLFTCCEESQTHSFVCDSSQLVNRKSYALTNHEVMSISLVICVALPGKRICPSDICSPSWETHLPSDMCSPTRETHIPSDMCCPT